MLLDPSTDNDKQDGMETEAGTMNEDVEDAEDELDEQAQGPGEHIRDWADLRKDIKDHLKKYSGTLPLSHINQLRSSQILPPYN